MKFVIFCILIALLRCVNIMAEHTTPQQKYDKSVLNLRLYKSFEIKDYKMMRFFLKQGADINFAMPLNGHELLKYIIRTDESSLSHFAKEIANRLELTCGLSMLDSAVLNDDLKMVEFLLINGAKPNVDEQGRNLLFYAHSPEMAKLLIKHGLSTTHQDYDGNLPLHSALNDDVELVNTLAVPRMTLNTPNKFGQTILHRVCFVSNKNSHCKTVKKLLDLGADCTIKDKGGATALMYAVTHQNSIIIKMLIDSCNNIDCQDADGNTALHYAYSLDRTDNIKILLDLGANPHLKNREGKCFNEIKR